MSTNFGDPFEVGARAICLPCPFAPLPPLSAVLYQSVNFFALFNTVYAVSYYCYIIDYKTTLLVARTVEANEILSFQFLS